MKVESIKSGLIIHFLCSFDDSVYELVDSSLRSQVTSISYASWSLGTCGLALVAYLAGDYIVLSVVMSVPFLLYLPAMWWGLQASNLLYYQLCLKLTK